MNEKQKFKIFESWGHHQSKLCHFWSYIGQSVGPFWSPLFPLHFSYFKTRAHLSQEAALRASLRSEQNNSISIFLSATFLVKVFNLKFESLSQFLLRRENSKIAEKFYNLYNIKSKIERVSILKCGEIYCSQLLFRFLNCFILKGLLSLN